MNPGRRPSRARLPPIGGALLLALACSGERSRGDAAVAPAVATAPAAPSRPTTPPPRAVAGGPPVAAEPPPAASAPAPAAPPAATLAARRTMRRLLLARAAPRLGQLLPARLGLKLELWIDAAGHVARAELLRPSLYPESTEAIRSHLARLRFPEPELAGQRFVVRLSAADLHPPRPGRPDRR